MPERGGLYFVYLKVHKRGVELQVFKDSFGWSKV